MVTAKMQTQGFKMAAHKPMCDIMDAMSIIYKVYGTTPESNLKLILF